MDRDQKDQKGKQVGQIMQSSEINYDILCETAVNYAKKFGKDFSYNKKDIADMDNILQYYHEDILKTKPTEKQVRSMALIWGAYLGQCLLNNRLKDLGFEWIIDRGEPILAQEGRKNKMAPVSKVLKRLLNGPEDSVALFYDAAIDIAEGRFRMETENKNV